LKVSTDNPDRSTRDGRIEILFAIQLFIGREKNNAYIPVFPEVVHLRTLKEHGGTSSPAMDPR
jgi:hypothetical protein